MSRQQRFDWFSLRQQRQHHSGKRKQQARKSTTVSRQRRPRFETLEMRELLSVNSGQLTLNGPVSNSRASQPTLTQPPIVDGLWYIPDGAEIPAGFFNHDHDGDGVPDHTAAEHESGCCCEQCVAAAGGGHDHNGDGIPDHSASDHEAGCCCEECAAAAGAGVTVAAATASDPDGPAWPDFNPETPGFELTYSYSNFLDEGAFPGLTEEDLREATEVALGLWSSVAPITFIEVEDSGPSPEGTDGTVQYFAGDAPNLRFGQVFIDGDVGANVLAFAFFPDPNDPTISGLAGDVLFDNGNSFGVGTNSGLVDIVETLTHEIGHALGLGHEFEEDAILNPFIGNRFATIDDAFLLPNDIQSIQALYGVGEGEVVPLAGRVVNTLEDIVDPNDDLTSLREALQEEPLIGDTLTVSFSQDLAGGTIVLDPALGTLPINQQTEIIGLGSDQLTIDAAGNSQIFTIDALPPLGADGLPDPDLPAVPFTSPVSISGLTLTGANATTDGGAIFSTQDLVLNDVDIENSTTTGSGGAVFAGATLEISNSEFRDNSADGDGGAVSVAGDLTIDNSTIAGNSTNGNGDGGGLHITGQENDILILSSTISGNNSADDGGGINFASTNPFRLRILHSTVYDNTAGDNGGGVNILSGQLLVDHTIIAGNAAAGGTIGGSPDVDNINPFNVGPDGESLTPLLANFSLIGTGAGATIDPLGQGNAIGGLAPISAGLGPLQDNGGPTRTHALLQGSLAINGGNPTIAFTPDFDQRGVGRIANGVIDIGAFEADGFAQIYVVDTLVDEVDGDDSAGDLSLREAINLANVTPGEVLIRFSIDINGGTINLDPALGELVVTSDLIIDANRDPIFAEFGVPNLGISIVATGVVDNTGGTPFETGHRLFTIDDGDAENLINFELIGATLAGGNVAGNGGAIFSNENLSLDTVTIEDNVAAGDGGGIFHQNGGLLIVDSTIANNTALGDGVSTQQSNGFNSAPGAGGGLWTNTLSFDPNDPEFDPGTLTSQIINSTFSGNTSADEGGGIFNFNGLLTIASSTITENESTGQTGGGVISFAALGARTNVFSSIIAGNINTGEVDGSGEAIAEPDDVGVSRGVSPVFGNTFESLGFNLIGEGNALLAFGPDFGDDNDLNDTDLTGVNQPGLLPLADNGGLTQTHALVPGSPAIDASDPDAVIEVGPNTPEILPNVDQRGANRIMDGNGDETAILDIGAFEAFEPPAPNADFNDDNLIDGFDFLSWQQSFGTGDLLVAATGGDADFDGDVDGADLDVWTSGFGSTSNPIPVPSTFGNEVSLPAATLGDVVSGSAAVNAEDDAFATLAGLATRPGNLSSAFANTNDKYTASGDSASLDSAFRNDALDAISAGVATAQGETDYESDEAADEALAPLDAVFERFELSGFFEDGEFGV